MNICDLLNSRKLESLIDAGYIGSSNHPDLPLSIYNYTHKTQFEGHWTPETLVCRGLIIDEEGNITGRALDKFFSLDQYESLGIRLPEDKSYQVFDKVDGILFIVTNWQGHMVTATRGSFTSDWADIGRDVLRDKYPDFMPEEGKTYCFELTCPESRKESLTVVDYGRGRELTLLAIRDTTTGRELSLENLGPPIVNTYKDIKDWTVLKDSKNQENREGFVVKWDSGFRVKVKLDWYSKLHRIVSRTTKKAVWEALRDSIPMDEILEDVPDEFMKWFKHTRDTLTGQYRQVERICKKQFKDLGDRKKTAIYFTSQCKYPAVMFKMLDGKDYSDLIWKIVKPAKEMKIGRK